MIDFILRLVDNVIIATGQSNGPEIQRLHQDTENTIAYQALSHICIYNIQKLSKSVDRPRHMKSSTAGGKNNFR